MTITSLKSALQRIAQLEQENEQLRAELEVYKNRNTGGRKKHDEAWMTSYRDFAVKYEKWDDNYGNRCRRGDQPQDSVPV